LYHTSNSVIKKLGSTNRSSMKILVRSVLYHTSNSVMKKLGSTSRSLMKILHPTNSALTQFLYTKHKFLT
jgi:hypothetical protein